MPAITTLKARADFLRMNRARKTITPFFILRSAARSDGASAIRVGYTVTTQCGNAAVRNRIKRRLRALVREYFPDHATSGHDYVFIALAKADPSVADAEFAQLRTAMQRALAHAALVP